MDNKPDFFIDGNKCWVQTLGGTHGRFNNCMCVEIIDPPLRNNTLIEVVTIVFSFEFIPA